MNFKSGFLQEFYKRGFYDNSTHAALLDDKLSNSKITAYIGFDCTAQSLHAGSLIQIMILRLLLKYGHNVIVLLGGGTTKIGDPSGKDSSRQLLNNSAIDSNLDSIKAIINNFIPQAAESQITFVNNNDWLKDLNYIDFLRDIGKHFSINRMLNYDSVKLRLDREQNLSFLEFNYMILQSYDFYKLNQEYDCTLQIGGSDQWGNIVNGVELTRKLNFESHQDSTAKAKEVYGLTSPLLTTANGSKMGKTADGAVWLDAELLDPYDYFQYFRNIDDRDVGKFLKLFTELDLQNIAELEQLKDQEINKAKEVLAYEATKICHGLDNADASRKKAQETFVKKTANAFTLKEIKFESELKLTEIMKQCQSCESLGQAKKLILGNAVRINDQVLGDINHSFTQKCSFNLQVGKKKFYKVNLI